ncbi:hypothetical protein LTR17_011918 [Elasticomyces elasticus]|nr:hypothetical protein LTR17_011918 [Elasticomyces elasticus]
MQQPSRNSPDEGLVATSPRATGPKKDLADQDSASTVPDASRNDILLPNLEEPSSASIRAPRQTLLAESLVKLGGSEIGEHMRGIEAALVIIPRQTLEGIPDELAVWPKPGVELLKLYERILGKKYKARLAEITTTQRVSNVAALEACLAAAVFEYVFDKDPPWDGPEQMTSNDELYAPFINRILEQEGSRWTIEKLRWQAEHDRLQKEQDGNDFLKGELQRVAEDLALDIVLVLDRQLKALGARGRGLTKDITRLVSNALTLRGKLRAAPDYFQLEWVKSGAATNPDAMWEFGEETGKRREVLWCLTPAVWYRSTKMEPWKMFTRARVCARAMPTVIAS